MPERTRRRAGIRLQEARELEGRPFGETRPWILGIHPRITRRVETVRGSWSRAMLPGVVGQKLRLPCMHSREFRTRDAVSPRVDIYRLYNFSTNSRKKKSTNDYDDRARNYCKSIPR